MSTPRGPVDELAGDPVAEAMAAERLSLTRACRRDPARLGALLAADFREVGASGTVYTRAEVVAVVAADSPAEDDEIAVTDLRGRLLAPGLVMVTYRAESAGRHTHRTSLWRRAETGRWEMFHHQGTLIPA